MINKQKIKYNEAIYYIPSYTSPRKVSILKLLNDSMVVVKPYSKKQEQQLYEKYKKQFMLEILREKNHL